MRNYLKLSLILSFCFFELIQAAPPEQDIEAYFKYLATRVEEVRDKCEEESGATYDDLEALDEGKIPETETGKCMIACEFIEYGIINEDHKYNKDGIYDMLPKYLREDKTLDNFRKLTDRCERAVEKVEEGDVCELARKLKLCFQQHASEFGIKMFMDVENFGYIDYKK
ncbi:general odorant-binding protein 19d [Chrysoperla carnea]|uniref:general odorant-binding protein 19d n=1 Tax=Chrysoperla carnea TaxID=189513 RepID=UPI001D05D543|nr:general odorant-binding protein 19d [Chrysoperla carnea]